MKTALSVRKAIEIRYLFTKAQQETGIGIISQVPWQWRGGGIWKGGNQENWWSMGEITGSLGGASGKEPACQSRRQEMRVQSLGLEDLLEEGTVTHSNVLAWRIPWTEEPGGLQSTGSQRVGRNWSDVACTHGRNQIPQITSQTFAVRSSPLF